MQPNPLLKRLGFAPTDRLVILHCDDVGMCQASVDAFADLYDFGLISSGAVMVPCPWFLEAAAFARTHPQADLGIHLTLTAEFSTYRWGPISTRDLASGMVDAQGYFYARTPDAIAHGDPSAVQTEIEAQVARALAAGMHPTHADTHMGSVATTKFLGGYVRMALTQRLPALLMRQDEAGWRSMGLDADTAAIAVNLIRQLEALGVPMLDGMAGMPLGHANDHIALAQSLLAGLPAGVTHFILHPARNTPELRAIAPDWQARVANYEAFHSEELRRAVQESGVQVIGYRALQDLMPNPQDLATALGEIL